MAQFKDYINNFSERISQINDLFSIKELTVSIDKLKKANETDHEILYFKTESKEAPGIILFGSEFYQTELNEQEFKKLLGQNALNFQILRAYKRVSSKQDKVKIGDILNDIQDKRKDSNEVHLILRRILTLSYYFDWEIKKDKKDFEGDSFIKIPDKFLIKLKQKFDFSNITSVYENDEVFVFVNGRGKLNLVFKDKNKFTRKDVERVVYPALKKIFGIKKITSEIDL